MANKSESDTVTIEQSSCKTTSPHFNEPQYARSDITADSEAPSYSSRLDNNKYGKSPINKKEKMSPYQFFRQHYTKFSTSFMLENKASTARDHLANERTFLAWIRTSLTLITVGVAITQLYHLTPKDSPGGVPHEKSGKSLGAAFVIFSILFLYFANARYFHTQQAMTRGQFPASRGAILFGSACICGVLLAMFIVILLDLK